jgi:hypothetical protein
MRTKPKTLCRKCGYEGSQELFWRKDEKGEYILGSQKSAHLTPNDMGLFTKEQLGRMASYSPKEFCPKCDYVNGSDWAAEHAKSDAIMTRRRNKDLELKRNEASGCLGTLLVITLIVASLLLI